MIYKNLPAKLQRLIQLGCKIRFSTDLWANAVLFVQSTILALREIASTERDLANRINDNAITQNGWREIVILSPPLSLSLSSIYVSYVWYVKISYTSLNNEMKYENFPVQFISSLKHLLVSAFNVNGVAFLEYDRVYILTVSRGRTQLRFGISIPLILVDPSFRYTALIRPDILCALWTGWSWHTMRITQGNCFRALYNRRRLFTAISYAFSMKLITVVPR